MESRLDIWVDHEDELSLDQLQDEELLVVISHLPIWDAFALEAVSRRFYDLVRHYQKTVQKFVDVSFPLIGKVEGCYKFLEKVVLPRFGAKLKRIKINSEHVHVHNYGNKSFIENLALRCPNLTEYPVDYLRDICKYQRLGSGQIKTLKLRHFDDDFSMARLNTVVLKTCPKLEELRLDFGNSFSPVWLLDGLSASNTVRCIDMGMTMNILDSSFAQVASALNACPKLSHLKLRLRPPCSLGGARSLRDLIESLRCQTTCELYYTIWEEDMPETFYEIVGKIVEALFINVPNDPNFVPALANFTKLSELTICLTPNVIMSQLEPLAVPSTVQKARFVVYGVDRVSYVVEAIKRQGKQFTALSLDMDHKKNCLEASTTLIDEVSLHCTSLKEFELDLPDSMVSSASLEHFLKTCGHRLETLRLSSVILSTFSLEVITTFCTSLKMMELNFVTMDLPAVRSILERRNLFVGLSELYEAEMNVMKRSWTNAVGRRKMNYDCKFHFINGKSKAVYTGGTN